MSVLFSSIFIVLISCYFVGVFSGSSGYYYYTKFGPKYPPSQGEVWPTPQREQKTIEYFVYNSSKFEAVVSFKYLVVRREFYF